MDISYTETEAYLIRDSSGASSQKPPARMHGGDDIDRNNGETKERAGASIISCCLVLSLAVRSAFRFPLQLAVFSLVTLVEGGVDSVSCREERTYA